MDKQFKYGLYLKNYTKKDITTRLHWKGFIRKIFKCYKNYKCKSNITSKHTLTKREGANDEKRDLTSGEKKDEKRDLIGLKL